mmetsp:Transcript_66950/g.117314  ORF Transcript_66950/g.117314 Transcript_66950/m.117314 type:complete len:489 (+) Transcript_66950:72-1538(+)
MESDTLAYDGDAEAWAQWQVPLPDPARSSPEFSAGAGTEPEVAADAPTLNYELDEQGGNESFSASHAVDSSEYPGARLAEDGASEQDVRSVSKGPTLEYASEAPTLAYDTQIEPSDAPADGGPTRTCETQMLSDSLSADEAEEAKGVAATELPNAAAMFACETQVLSDSAMAFPSAADTLAYETQFMSAAPAAMPESPTNMPSTIAYDPHGFTAEALAPTVVHGETQEIGPTLAYGEDAFIPDVADHPETAMAPPSRQISDASPPADVTAASAAVRTAASTLQYDGAELVGDNTSVFRAAPSTAPEGSSRKRCATPLAAGDTSEGSSKKHCAPSLAPAPARSSTSPATSSAASSASAAPTILRRVRLVGKQPPRGVYALAAQSTSSSSSAPSAAPRSSAQTRRSATSATEGRKHEAPGVQAPSRDLLEMGTKVKVCGDGWGGGSGDYLATVTEADSLTFTVIRQVGEKWEETHVLRTHCTIVGGGASR